MFGNEDYGRDEGATGLNEPRGYSLVSNIRSPPINSSHAHLYGI